MKTKIYIPIYKIIAKTIDKRNGAVKRDTVGVSDVKLSLGLVQDMKIESGKIMNKLMYKTSLLLMSVPTWYNNVIEKN